VRWRNPQVHECIRNTRLLFGLPTRSITSLSCRKGFWGGSDTPGSVRRTVHALCLPKIHKWIVRIKIETLPIDESRFTEDGLKRLVGRIGTPVLSVKGQPVDVRL